MDGGVPEGPRWGRRRDTEKQAREGVIQKHEKIDRQLPRPAA